MNLLVLSAFASTALLAGGEPSTSSSTQPIRIETNQPADTGTAPGPHERRICRYLQTTGSRTMNRLCMTARQWLEFERSH